MNCLTNALDQWSANKTLKILYNGNHVIAIEPIYEITPKTPCNKGSWTPQYIPIETYKIQEIIKSFKLTEEYRIRLIEYVNYQSYD